jgi:hypothetical protein
LSSMKDTYSVLELQNVANNLPQGIDEAQVFSTLPVDPSTNFS